MIYTIPSADTIQRHIGWVDKIKGNLEEGIRLIRRAALDIHRLGFVEISPEFSKAFPKTSLKYNNRLRWSSAGFLIEEALDELLESFGWEFIPKEETKARRGLHYMNTGDPYTPTIIRYSGSTRFWTCSTGWGELVKI